MVRPAFLFDWGALAFDGFYFFRLVGAVLDGSVRVRAEKSASCTPGFAWQAEEGVRQSKGAEITSMRLNNPLR